MTRFFFLSFLLLAACGTVPNSSTDTATTPEPSSEQGEYGWGSAGSDDGTDTTTDSGATETDSGDSDSGTGTTDSGTGTIDTAAEDLTVTAKVWIYPDAEYDISSPNYGVSTPSICMFDVVVNSEFPSNYGACAATSSVNVYMADPEVEYIPGADLIIQAKWPDSIRDRYYAEKSGVVNAVEERVVIEFPDGTWQAYWISGAEPTAPGQAGWTENGDGSGGEVHVWTFEDSLDHRDR